MKANIGLKKWFKIIIEKLSKKRIDLKSLLLPLYIIKLLSTDNKTKRIKKLLATIFSSIGKFNILKTSIVSAL